MSTQHDPKDDCDSPGSPPCLLHLLGPDGMPDVDPRQTSDVARWRKAERERLIAARQALPADYRAAQTRAMVRELDQLIRPDRATLISGYWPIRAEPDLRSWMRTRRALGARIALPVAVQLRQPLAFREWRPDASMVRGLWGIPYPADAHEVIPTVMLVPLVGYDAQCYRLGYGGGFFDRTLAGMAAKPLVIGLGYSQLSIATIYPQPHDIPMDWIVTGAQPPMRRSR